MGRGGRRDPDEYELIKAEVYYDNVARKNKVRPCKGEKFSQNMNVECAREIRNYKIGRKIGLRVVDTERENGKLFLYSSYKWPHEVIK